MGRPFDVAGARWAMYRVTWRAFCMVSIVLVVLASALLLPGDVLVLALLVMPVAAVTAATMYDGGSKTARWTRRQVAAAAAVAAGAITLVFGLSGPLGPDVLWLSVLLAVSSPPAVRWYSRGFRFGSSTGRGDVLARSTAELCRQWQDSYEALRRARNTNQRLRIVMERQRCLDELDRRDPEGLQAWLASAASAAGDPSRFLKSQS